MKRALALAATTAALAVSLTACASTHHVVVVHHTVTATPTHGASGTIGGVGGNPSPTRGTTLVKASPSTTCKKSLFTRKCK